MLRKLLVASALVLSLSACKPATAAEPFDYSTTFKQTNAYYAVCANSIQAMVGVEVTNGMVAKADKACAFAIAGSYTLSNQEGGTRAFAEWLADHPKEGSAADIQNWSVTVEMVNALIEYAGPDNLPYLGALYQAIQTRQGLSL